jgi:hypothetical protein
VTSQPSTSKNARATGRSPGAYMAATWCSVVKVVNVGVVVVVIPPMLESAAAHDQAKGRWLRLHSGRRRVL